MSSTGDDNSYGELLQPCALFPSQERAQHALEFLHQHEIEASLTTLDERLDKIPNSNVQLSVPGTQLARARALLNSLGRESETDE